MKTKLFYPFLFFALLVFASCEKENGSDSISTSKLSATVSNNTAIDGLTPCVTTNLMAGQNYDVGDVKVFFDLDSVYVQYETTSNWFIKKTHLYVGDCELIPVTRNGSPIPGQFPISTSYPSGTQSVIYAIAKSGLPECFCIAAHAEVYRVENGQIVQTETAWAAGERFTPKSWAMFFSVCQSDCFDIEDYYFGN